MGLAQITDMVQYWLEFQVQGDFCIKAFVCDCSPVLEKKKFTYFGVTFDTLAYHGFLRKKNMIF